MEKLSESDVRDILLSLVVDSPYRHTIILEIEKVAHLANENEMLNQALHHIIQSKEFSSNRSIVNNSDTREAIAQIHHFFEYLYFTSEEFLQEQEND